LINKIKDIAHKGISLVLAFSMMMPTTAFAKDYTVDNWDKYKVALKEGIEDQEENITITFKDGMAVVSESAARFMINNAYEEVKKKLPKYYGELNIARMNPDSVLDGTLLKKAIYTIEYKNSAQNFADIETILNEEYRNIKSKTTNYEKIKAIYDYIIDNLDYKSGSGNHDIYSGLKTADKESVSADAYAMLFAMMMDELGYENDIVVGGTIKEAEEPHTWNLVKVQGNWYHVDSRLGEVESDRYKFFLTSDDIMKNDYKHQWQGYEDKPAGKIYDKDNSENAEAEFIARQKLDEAEKLLIEVSAVNDMEVNIAVNKAYNITVEVQDLVNALNNIELKGIIETINMVKAAKDKIVIAEKDGGATKGNIDTAKNAVNQVNAKYINIKTNLDDRIKKLEEKLKNSEEQEIIDNAKDAVDNAEKSIKNITAEGSLATIIETAEAAVKTAETEIKKIKDTAIRTNQQNRIKAIKLVITAMKAVDKAETAIPLKMTYVTSAETAIGKISEDYQTEIEVLNARLVNVESKINLTDIISKAVKAVEKAEKSMKETDLDLARDAVKLITDTDIQNKLNRRIRATDRVVQAEISLGKYMEDPTDDEDLEGKITEANLRVSELEDTDANKTKLKDRMKVISNSKIAIESVEEVRDDGTTENIKKAEDAIDKVTDSKIKKELEKRLKNIISQKDTEDKEKAAKNAVVAAENSLKEDPLNPKDPKESKEPLDKNKEAVDVADDAVKKLTGTLKKQLQAIIKDLNNAIKAKEAVENAEGKMDKGNLTAKDVTTAEKAISTVLDTLYIPGLKERLNILISKLKENEAGDLLNKAIEAVEKAKTTKATKDISAAKKAISLVKDETKKLDLTKQIEELEVQIAKDAMTNAEGTKISKDITAAKKAIDAISNKISYKTDIDNLNARFKAMESYIATIKVLESAEKNKNQENYNAAVSAFTNFGEMVKKIAEDDKDVYNTMIEDIKDRIEYIQKHLENVAETEEEARKAIEAAEAEMKVVQNEDGTKVVLEPDNSLIQDAQNAVNKVTDKKIKSDLQKRIDAIQIAKDAKTAVTRAMAYPNEKSVKDAETALNKVDGRYSDIIEFLGDEIAKLKNKLDISKKVDEATKLVQKAVDSRIAADSIKARFAVEAIKELAFDSYERLIKILDELDESIGNEAEDETKALEAAKIALTKVFEIIDEANTSIAKIIEGEDGEAEKIQKAYEMIESAKIEVINANAAVRKLTEQKGLLDEIKYANEQIDLSEDNIDVKEAVRLVTIASSSVLNAKTEEDKSKARLDIAAARRAIDKIGHNNNKDIKKTILNTINSIEKKLTSDNDQEIIDEAVDAVNAAADLLAKAVRDEKVMERQEEIDKAIFAAKMAIGWISDDNKAAKDTLTGFINDIEAMYKAEKAGIENEERIRNAEKAVSEAEAKKGSDDLETYIRVARLRVKIIINDGPDTKAKIDELNARLDVLEGKGSGNSGGNGNGGGSGNGGNNNSGGNKPGGNNSNGNIIPTTPLPDNKRSLGAAKPQWGKTKELKNATPVTDLPLDKMLAFKVNDSKIKILELTNMLKASPNANAELVVRGKSIKLDSKPYIQNKVNYSILVPIKSIGDELGFSVSLIDNSSSNGAKRILINGIVYGESKSIIMDLGSENCYVNGYLVKISSSSVIQEGRAYIPIDFLVEYLGLTFSYYNNNGNYQLIFN
jgi:hypothetical protein